jgi:hypothetical protein
MTKITQLFEHLELLTEGDPPRHTLFILSRLPGEPDRLLLIDPPPDVTERFNLPDDVTSLFTSQVEDVGIPALSIRPGEVNHIRVGQHLLDVHARQGHTIVVMPALGLICGGDFGSDLALPELAPRSDGTAELETLRELARLVKERTRLLYVPRVGSMGEDRVTVMTRLAEDVGYIHGLRRVIPAAIRRGDGLPAIQQLAATLMPENRRTELCRQRHTKNVTTLFHALQSIL